MAFDMHRILVEIVYVSHVGTSFFGLSELAMVSANKNQQQLCINKWRSFDRTQRFLIGSRQATHQNQAIRIFSLLKSLACHATKRKLIESKHNTHLLAITAPRLRAIEFFNSLTHNERPSKVCKNNTRVH